MSKNLEEWTTSDSVFWLEYGLKLPKYCANFNAVPLTGNMMVRMSEAKLRKDLNIRDRPDWLKIIEAINELKREDS